MFLTGFANIWCTILNEKLFLFSTCDSCLIFALSHFLYVKEPRLWLCQCGGGCMRKWGKKGFKACLSEECEGWGRSQVYFGCSGHCHLLDVDLCRMVVELWTVLLHTQLLQSAPPCPVIVVAERLSLGCHDQMIILMQEVKRILELLIFCWSVLWHLANMNFHRLAVNWWTFRLHQQLL